MPVKNKRLLMIGPFPKPTTGVSLANAVVKEILEETEGYKVKHLNTSLDRFDESVGSFSFYKLFYNLKFNLSSYKVIQTDILYLTPGQTFFGIAKYAVFIFIAALFGKELIIHVHGNHLGKAYSSLTGFKKWFFKTLIKKTDKGIVLSESLKDNMTPFIDESKVYPLCNFAEDYLFHESEKKKVTSLRIVYLSNLMEEKGILVLLEALRKLEEANIPYEGRIAGNVDKENETTVYAAFKRLNQTEYLGPVYGAEKKSLLEWGNTFVLPTFYTMEGQPISILEAMATQNTIVTTAHAGIPDVITDGIHGFFTERKDSESLCNILKKLAENPAQIEAIAHTNKEVFLEKYTRQQFAKELLHILEE